MANYTTATRVRLEAGFVGNANIVDGTDIDPLIDQSHGIILGTLAQYYDINNLTTSALFTGSQAENLLKRAEELIAAGYLLLREYTLEGDASNDVGMKKLQEGKGLLAQIIDEESPVRLLDINGTQFATGTSANGASLLYTGNTTLDTTFKIADTY